MTMWLVYGLSCCLIACQKVPTHPVPNECYGEAPKLQFVPGDIVEVKFFYTPELNEAQAVRPDGNIALPFVGDVKVQDKTPEEVRSDLLKRYSVYLKNPEITVLAKSLSGHRVYVGGEVKSPGFVEMLTRMTALEAITQAGGFDMQKAEAGSVVVVRLQGTKQYGYILDLRGAIAGKPTQPFFLEPRDVVFVPRTTIVKINQFVEQYFNRIVPQIGMMYEAPVGGGLIGIDTRRW